MAVYMSRVVPHSFPDDGNGRVVLSGLRKPTPPTPTPSVAVTIKEKEKALYAFYRSIADSESGQRWNFWRYAFMTDPMMIQYPIGSQTNVRVSYQGPFFPNYQKKGPFKF